MEQLLKVTGTRAPHEQGKRTPIEHFREILRSRICRKCIDGSTGGMCRLPAVQVCPLEAFLPTVVGVILASEGRPRSDYVKAVRTNVCAHCDEQDWSGECERRNRAECPLDRYFPHVVRAIEDARMLTGR